MWSSSNETITHTAVNCRTTKAEMKYCITKVLSNPKTGLILDDPTNDLDLETMDLLTEMLSNDKGTLLIVSHDRDCLDQTVNKILYFEGDGKVSFFLGGYSDFLKHKSNELQNSVLYSIIIYLLIGLIFLTATNYYKLK